MKRDRSENRGQSTPLPYILGRSENLNRIDSLIFLSEFPVETKFWRLNT